MLPVKPLVNQTVVPAAGSLLLPRLCPIHLSNLYDQRPPRVCEDTPRAHGRHRAGGLSPLRHVRCRRTILPRGIRSNLVGVNPPGHRSPHLPPSVGHTGCSQPGYGPVKRPWKPKTGPLHTREWSSANWQLLLHLVHSRCPAPGHLGLSIYL